MKVGDAYDCIIANFMSQLNIVLLKGKHVYERNLPNL